MRQLKLSVKQMNKNDKFLSKQSWFQDALDALHVTEESGWPDKFGKRMDEWLYKHGSESINLLSLFTGCGGLDIGFHDLGMHADEMVEIEKNFVKTLEKNSLQGGYFEGSQPKCIDIRNYTAPKGKKVDFIIGGPPCQTFSSAGRRASGVLGTTDPRGMLFKEYVRLLQELKPKGFLFENVYGIVGAQDGKPWEEIKKAFSDIGYKIHYKILNAADYGVPQHRERLIIIGLKEGSFKFPMPTHGPDSTDNRPYYTAGQAVKNLIDDESHKKVNGKYGHLLEDIPPGMNYSFYTEKLGHPRPVFAWRSKFSDFLYKADPEKPVRAIKAQGGQYTGPLSWENRYFTVNEMKRLQTIPDEFELVGNRQTAIHQIGNSVPTQFARILALSVLDQIFGVKVPFKVDYMPENFELTFRQLKRNQTEEYERLAKEKIKIIIRRVIDKSDHPTDITQVRYLTKDFKWLKEKSDNAKEFQYRTIVTGNKVEISLNKNTKNKKADWVYKIEINHRTDHLKGGGFMLYSYDKDIFSITALWKSLEEYLHKTTGIADLVQYSGYYQYAPALSAKFETTIKKENAVIKALKHIVRLQGVIQLESDRMSEFLGVSSDKLLEILRSLRELGYEIRNHNTNPQIPEGTIMIPYLFPTLTPQSVQLRKKL